MNTIKHIFATMVGLLILQSCSDEGMHSQESSEIIVERNELKLEQATDNPDDLEIPDFVFTSTKQLDENALNDSVKMISGAVSSVSAFDDNQDVLSLKQCAAYLNNVEMDKAEGAFMGNLGKRKNVDNGLKWEIKNTTMHKDMIFSVRMGMPESFRITNSLKHVDLTKDLDLQLDHLVHNFDFMVVTLNQYQNNQIAFSISKQINKEDLIKDIVFSTEELSNLSPRIKSIDVDIKAIKLGSKSFNNKKLLFENIAEYTTTAMQ